MRTANQRFEAVVFDKDGVLADSERINLRSAFEVFHTHGFPLGARAASEIVGRHPSDYLPVLANRLGIRGDQQERMLEEKDRIYRRMWEEHGRLFECSHEVLLAVRRRGVRVGIATSSTRAELHDFLRRFDLAGLFDIALSRDDVVSAKPDPEVYSIASHRLGVAPRHMVVVEDSEYGVQSANAAGAFCVVVRTEHVPPQRVAIADAHIDSLRDLLPLLAELEQT